MQFREKTYDVTPIFRLKWFAMKILLATLLVSLGQAALAQDQVVKEFAGCYELRVERSKYVFENYGHQFLPKGLELTAERGALGRFAVRGFDFKDSFGFAFIILACEG